ncbi:MAG: VCBS repeat-containing protein [Bacteroidetes bacterium]|jgi:hypothetical protein|nr:VCBS repeat-containing protein [Bacteroidota bacterium]
MKQQLFLLLSIFVFAQSLSAQVFIEHDKQVKPKIQASAVWIPGSTGLDLVVSGELIQAKVIRNTAFYKKDASHRFRSTAKGLPDFSQGDMDVTDFNKDGRMDIIITGLGTEGQQIAGLYLQQSNGMFQLSRQEIPALINGSVQFGDFDNDRDEDVLITGKDRQGRLQTFVLVNQDGQLQQQAFGLPGVVNGEASWKDANKDGYFDIFITGMAYNAAVSSLYVFRNGEYLLHPQEFKPLHQSGVLWADFNNDGHQDFILAGADVDGLPYTRIFTGNKGFYFDERMISGLRPLKNLSMDAGDFDADGDIDFVMAGESLERPYTILYENLGNGVFKDFIAGFPGVSEGVVRFGDFDNDGDLDLFLMGIDVCYNLIGTIYRNNTNPERIVEDSITNIFIDSPIVERVRGPYYYFVFSSCFCDIDNSGKKSYHAFVSNIHQEKRDFNLTYIFNDLLIKQFPGWGWSDRGHRTSNAFISIQDAEEGRKQVIGAYKADNFEMHYINW